MNAFEAFEIHQAITLHFSTNSGYDYFRYQGKTTLNEKYFQTRHDKYNYYKLSKIYKSPDEIKNFCVANFVKDIDKAKDSRFLLTQEASEVFTTWKKRTQSLTYTFKEEYQLIIEIGSTESCSTQFPEIFKLILSEEVSLETFIILKKLNPKISSYYRTTFDDDPVIIPILDLVEKYEPFLHIDMTKIMFSLKIFSNSI